MSCAAAHSLVKASTGWRVVRAWTVSQFTMLAPLACVIPAVAAVDAIEDLPAPRIDTHRRAACRWCAHGSVPPTGRMEVAADRRMSATRMSVSLVVGSAGHGSRPLAAGELLERSCGVREARRRLRLRVHVARVRGEHEHRGDEDHRQQQEDEDEDAAGAELRPLHLRMRSRAESGLVDHREQRRSRDDVVEMGCARHVGNRIVDVVGVPASRDVRVVLRFLRAVGRGARANSCPLDEVCAAAGSSQR